MTRYIKLSAVAAAAMLAAPAFAATDVSANAEFDTSFYKDAVAGGSNGGVNDKFTQGGRLEVNITGKAKVGDGYVAGKGTAILNNARGASTDDSWVEGGVGAFSVRLGTFEATALASTPADVLVTGRVGYMGDLLRGRTIGAQDSYVALPAGQTGKEGQPHFTFNVDLGSGLAIELGVVEENTGANVITTPAVAANPNANPPVTAVPAVTSNSVKFGVRPVFKFAVGPVSGAVGLEKSGLPNSKVGVAGTGAFDIGGGASVGVNLASQGKDSNSGQTSSATGFGVFGSFAGATLALQSGKDHFGNTGNYVYGTYGFPFFVPAATAYIGVSTGKTPSNVVGGGSVKESGIRFRVHYDF